MCGIPRWAILHSMWGRVQDAHSQHSKTHTTQQDHDNWTHTTGYVTHTKLTQYWHTLAIFTAEYYYTYSETGHSNT